MMEVEGIVTNVDSFFWFFDLNNQTRVHISILVSQNLSYKLPELNSKVSLKFVHRYGSIFVACASSVINGSFKEEGHYSCKFIKFVSTYQLGAPDLIMMDKCLQMLEKNFNDIDKNLRHSLVFSMLENAIHQSETKVHNNSICCRNKIISHIDIISVTSCRFIKIEPKSYTDFPFWSFGINRKPSKHVMLFGILQVHNCYGFFMMKDSLYQIACVIYNCTARELCELDNKYILIKDYRVITEIYNAEGVPNVEYIILDFTNVITISSTQGTIQHKKIDAKFDQTMYKYNVGFEIMKKSNVLIGTSNEPEFHLEILISNINESKISEKAFLIVPKEYIPSLIFLEINGFYKLHHNEPLEIARCFELVRIANYKTYEIKEKGAHFQLQKTSKGPESIMTVEECKNSLLNRTSLCSFKGVLKQKKFANSLPSRTIKRTKLYGFGTPGAKVNQMVFSYTNSSGKEEYLDCYLNNWENILMPLGLIPEMEIIVRNVAPQSRKYLKATVLTTINIVSYRPNVEFQTVNLYINKEVDWGPQYFLGQGNQIPFSVLIWGRVSGIQILSVKLSKICKKCKLVNETSGCCTQCGEQEKITSFLSKLHVSDEYGQSKVLVKDFQCMKVFLDLQDRQSQIFFKAFDEIGEYNYSSFQADHQLTDSNNEKESLKNLLTKYLTTFNKCSLSSFDLKCRKLDSNPSKNGGRPLWFLLDIRRS